MGKGSRNSDAKQSHVQSERGGRAEEVPGYGKTMTHESSEGIDTETGSGTSPQLSPALQGHLGRQLRAVYTELVHEPMPDRFTKLLQELASSQANKPSKDEE